MTRGEWAGSKIRPNQPQSTQVSGSARPVRLKTLNMSARNWTPTRSVIRVFFTIPKSSLLWPGPRVCGRKPGELPKRRAKELPGESGGVANARGFRYCVPLVTSRPCDGTVWGTPGMTSARNPAKEKKPREADDVITRGTPDK